MKKFFKFIIIPGLVIFILALTFLYISYPKKHEKSVKKYCDSYGVEYSLVYAVIRAESSFEEAEISKAGAVGLMQIMPATAKFIAEELGVEKYDLKNADDNINFGVWYLKYLFKKFKDERLVIYAYNAGESVVREWIKVGKIEDFPYKETRDYYLRVTRAKKTYKRLYKI